MELTRKQKILLGSLTGVAVLLLLGLILWIALSGSGEPVPEEPPLPSFTAEPTPTPTETPAPSPTPTPTPYYLPLVPDETRIPTATAPSSPEADAGAARIRTDARVGRFDADCREFAAIGTRNGAAVAVLLVRVQPPLAEITAIPAETEAPVYTLGENAEVLRLDLVPIGTACMRAKTQRAGCWNLVWAIKNLVGVQVSHYLCVDLACMDAFFSFVPAIETDGGSVDAAAFSAILDGSGAERAELLGAFGVGVVRYLSEISLWEIPAFKAAAKDAFSASLSVLELLSLMRALKSVQTFSVSVHTAA